MHLQNKHQKQNNKNKHMLNRYKKHEKKKTLLHNAETQKQRLKKEIMTIFQQC
jgi:hypothetical protein